MVYVDYNRRKLAISHYLVNRMGKPMWGVGQLLLEQFYKWGGFSASWSWDEYLVLANALEVSNEPFIWVIQIGAGRLDPPCHLTGLDRPAEGNYFHSGLGSKASKKGLIIDGWAPQLLILNHG